MRSLLFSLAILVTLSSQGALAQGGIWGDKDSFKDGTAGAVFGTNIHNTFINPNNPLPIPQSDSAIISNTLYNIGSGMKPGEALEKAMIDTSGVMQLKPDRPRNDDIGR